MLVLSRKVNERIEIGEDVVVTIVYLGPGKVRIGIDAPPHVQVLRHEAKVRQKAECGPGPFCTARAAEEIAA